MTTLRQTLTDLPTLATEAFLTIDHPNPTNRPERGGTATGSRPPTNLDAIDALMPRDPDQWGHGLLWELAQCSRVALEAIEAAGEPIDNLPALPNPCTWAGECGWLLATFDVWQSCIDDVDLDAIDDSLRRVHRGLLHLTRTRPPLRVRCTRVQLIQRCNGRIVGRDEKGNDTDDLAKSRWCYCADCGQTYTYDAEIKRLGQLQRLPLSAWASELGVPLERLRKRINRLGLRPDGTDRNGRKLYDRQSIEPVLKAG